MMKAATVFLEILAACVLMGPVASAFRHVKDTPPPGVEPAEEHLAIVVNKSNPVDNLSFAELRSIYLAERKHWPNGQKITLVMRSPGQPEREAALRLIYRMSESDFNRYFLQTTFTGQPISTPKLLDSAAGTRRFVFNVPGAIGYLRASDSDGSVKVLKVEGKVPGEVGYRIKLAGR
jgi:ABC-type phosphate transport system substrate-binding protein